MLRIIIKHFFIGLLPLVLLWPKTSFADSPPTLTSPSDNSSVSKSPKLSWEYSGECVTSGSCFLVEVDNESNFSSPEKSPYTNSQSYSPQGLNQGTWHWRVKAKDKSEKWSEWSSVFKFNVDPNSAQVPTAQSAPSESKTAEPKSEEKNNFEIKDLPSEINSDQEFEVSILLNLPDKPSTSFYLKGAFKKDDSSNYFGQTLVSDWVKNSGKFTNQLKITTNDKGIWEGKIKVKPDHEDSGFTGTGDYAFKAARYTDSGSGPTWSNETKIKINAVSIPEPSVDETIVEASSESEEISYESSLVYASDEKDYEIKIASVAGASIKSDNTASEESKVLGERDVNWLLIGSGLLVFCSGFAFVFLKIKKGKINAKN